MGEGRGLVPAAAGTMSSVKGCLPFQQAGSGGTPSPLKQTGPSAECLKPNLIQHGGARKHLQLMAGRQMDVSAPKAAW